MGVTGAFSGKFSHPDSSEQSEEEKTGGSEDSLYIYY